MRSTYLYFCIFFLCYDKHTLILGGTPKISVFCHCAFCMHSPPNPVHPHHPCLSFHQSHDCWAALPCCYGDLAVNIPYESHSDKRPAAHHREIDGTFLQQTYSSAAREKKKRNWKRAKEFCCLFFVCVTGLVPLPGRDWTIPPVGYFNLVSGTKLLWTPLNFWTILLFWLISILYILQSLIASCGINLYSWYSVTPLTKCAGMNNFFP